MFTNLAIERGHHLVGYYRIVFLLRSTSLRVPRVPRIPQGRNEADPLVVKIYGVKQLPMNNGCFQ